MFASLGRFKYHGPSSVDEATHLLAELGADAQILAGGCNLIPELRRRQTTPSAVVGITGIPGLDHVAFDDDLLVIGALASLGAVERHPAVKEIFRVLYEGIHSIASVQVKATGTLVGNLCVATPASDIAPPLMVMEAEAVIANPDGHRLIPVADLFRGVKQTSLSTGELVTEVRVKRPPADTGCAFAKLTRTAADCAKINAAAHVVMENGRCKEARIVLGSVAPRPIRAASAEASLSGGPLVPEAIARAGVIAAEDIEPITDIRSTSEYRLEATKLLVGRVLETARDRATGDAS